MMLAALRKFHQQLRAGQLSKVQYQLRKQNIIATNFDKHNNFHQWLRELQKYCAELRKIHQKFRRKSSQELEELEAQLRKQNIIATKFDDTKQLPYPELRQHALPYPELRQHALPYPELRQHALPYPELRQHALPYPELRQQQLVRAAFHRPR